MSDASLDSRAHQSAVTPVPHADEEPDQVLKWRRHGDLLEGLVSHATDDGRTQLEWMTALRMSPAGTSQAVGDEELTTVAIEDAFDAYGQYHEEVAPGDLERVEKLGRIGRAIAEKRGATAGAGAVTRKSGTVQVCLWLMTEPEPV